MTVARHPTEQRVLTLSIWCTVALAMLGIIFGLLSGSQAIIFDGVFASIDAGMSILALVVSRLLLRSGSKRFQYGYWHLEPLVALFNGSVLLAICVYAFINGLKGMLSGGNVVSFDGALIYAVITCIGCFGLYFYERRVNRVLESEFITIDMNSFLMSGFITLGLFIGFGAAQILARAGYPQWEPYADSLILMIVVAGLAPVPLRIIRRALRDVFLIAPLDATDLVKRVMTEASARYRFIDYNMYVAKQGRMHMIDINVLVPPDYDATVVNFDAIRADIASKLGEFAHLDEWLSISFTSNRRWT
jgi:predicted Co/Zn/Cd cation transporter (cation efflux family)